MSLTNRFLSELADASETFANNLHDQISDLCESPIERIFLTGIVMILCMRGQPPAIIRKGQEQTDAGKRWFIEPQFHLLGYRADFVVGCLPRRDGKMIVVECDGHDFHERTKEQAARDRKRDRDFQVAGYKVFRFTGSEIHQSPLTCVAEVVKELLKMERQP